LEREAFNYGFDSQVDLRIDLAVLLPVDIYMEEWLSSVGLCELVQALVEG